MKLSEVFAIVTGGASGLGRATAEHLCREGATVVTVDMAEQTSTIPNTTHHLLDVSSGPDVEAFFDVLVNERAPNVLINCAGIAPAKLMVGKQGPVLLDHYQQVIGVNLLGTLNMARVFSYHLAQQPPNEAVRGVMLNTASVAAFEGQTGQSAYAASKAGVVGFTLPAARELAFFGIRVNTIAPGIMETPMVSQMSEEVQQSLSDAVTFPKRLGRPEEFASLCAHVIENDYINGEVIRLDGATRLSPK